MGPDAEASGDPSRDEIAIKWRTLQVEEQKLRLQKRQVWTGLATAGIPILILAGTIYDAGRKLERQAQIEFELEAARTILQARSPKEAVVKARFYEQLFPGRIPRNLAKQIDLKPYQGGARLDFVKAVSERGLSRGRWLNFGMLSSRAISFRALRRLRLR